MGWKVLATIHASLRLISKLRIEINLTFFIFLMIQDCSKSLNFLMEFF